MKKLVFTIFLYALVVVILSCSGTKAKEGQAGVHTHEDGIEHKDCDHENEEQTAPKQESFEVKVDSTETHEHDHNHEGDDHHNHQH